MARHVYLSRVPAAAAPEVEMIYRGQVGEHDDPESFAEKMTAAGHVVRVVDRFLGRSLALELLEG